MTKLAVAVGYLERRNRVWSWPWHAHAIYGQQIMTDPSTGHLVRGHFHICQTLATSILCGWRWREEFHTIKGLESSSFSISMLSQMIQVPIPRNTVKLQAYQQDYAWQKWAPSCRKVSKAECALLEEQHVQKCQLMDQEDLSVYSKDTFGWHTCSPSYKFIIT